MHDIPDEIKFLTRAKRYGAIEVQFESENIARKYAMIILNSEKLRLFTIYMERYIVWNKGWR